MNVEAERGEFASLIAPVLEPMAPVLEFFGVSIIMVGVMRALKLRTPVIGLTSVAVFCWDWRS